MRLNLGCGQKAIPGMTNVDVYPFKGVDQIVDLDQTPWPWEDSSVDSILLDNVLEHLGPTPKDFLRIVSEIYRVLKPDGTCLVKVPQWDHKNQWSDPTHIRPLPFEALRLFDSELCHLTRSRPDSKLSWMLGVDLITRKLNETEDELTVIWRAAKPMRYTE